MRLALIGCGVLHAMVAGGCASHFFRHTFSIAQKDRLNEPSKLALTYYHREDPVTIATDQEQWVELTVRLPAMTKEGQFSIDGRAVQAKFRDGGMRTCTQHGHVATGTVHVISRSRESVVAILDVAVVRPCRSELKIAGTFTFLLDK